MKTKYLLADIPWRLEFLYCKNLIELKDFKRLYSDLESILKGRCMVFENHKNWDYTPAEIKKLLKRRDYFFKFKE